MTNDSGNSTYLDKFKPVLVQSINEVAVDLDEFDFATITTPAKEEDSIKVFSMYKMKEVLKKEFLALSAVKGFTLSSLLREGKDVVNTNVDRWTYTFDFLNSLVDFETFSIPQSVFHINYNVSDYSIPSVFAPFVLPRKVTVSGSINGEDVVLRPISKEEDIDLSLLLAPKDFNTISSAIANTFGRDAIKKFDRGDVLSFSSLNMADLYFGNHISFEQRSKASTTFIQINPDFISTKYLDKDKWVEGAVEHINHVLTLIPMKISELGKRQEHVIGVKEKQVTETSVSQVDSE